MSLLLKKVTMFVGNGGLRVAMAVYALCHDSRIIWRLSRSYLWLYPSHSVTSLPTLNQNRDGRKSYQKKL